MARATAPPPAARPGGVAAKHGRALAQEQALQFAFSSSGISSERLPQRSAIRILGDVAIFVNMDSTDVWVHPELFELDEDLRPSASRRSARLLSPTGQRWGNPLYRWTCLPRRDSAARRSAGGSIASPRLRAYDIVVSIISGASKPTGRFPRRRNRRQRRVDQGAGLELFRALAAALGPLPLVAEDLG